MNCLHCGGELIHGGDHSYEDFGIDQEDGIVSNLTCINCSCFVEVYLQMEEEGQRPPAQIREEGLERFNKLYRAKWDAGQKSHGGCLDETVTIEKAEEEVMDNWAYLQSLRVLHNKQLKAIEDSKNEEINHWKERYREACKS